MQRAHHMSHELSSMPSQPDRTRQAAWRRAAMCRELWEVFRPTSSRDKNENDWIIMRQIFWKWLRSWHPQKKHVVPKEISNRAEKFTKDNSTDPTAMSNACQTLWRASKCFQTCCSLKCSSKDDVCITGNDRTSKHLDWSLVFLGLCNVLVLFDIQTNALESIQNSREHTWNPMKCSRRCFQCLAPVSVGMNPSIIPATSPWCKHLEFTQFVPNSSKFCLPDHTGQNHGPHLKSCN